MTEVSSTSGLDPFGEHYYADLVAVRCGEINGSFVGGHWDRKHKQHSDVFVSCLCGCQQRLLCREFERHAGRQAARSWLTSIKIADKTSAHLGDWIKKQCQKLGYDVVGQQIRMWLPAKRQSKRGRVTSYNGIEKEHSIQYEDGHEETLYLAIESYQLQGLIAEEGRAKRHWHSMEDDATSISTPRRLRVKKGSGQFVEVQSTETHSMAGAASTLVDLATTQPQTKSLIDNHATHEELSLTGVVSAIAANQEMLLRWQFMFSLQEPTLTMMHEQVRGVLLDLFLLDNRLLPRYLGKSWGASNEDPHKFISMIFKHCQKVITAASSTSLEKVQGNLFKLFKVKALGLV